MKETIADKSQKVAQSSPALPAESSHREVSGLMSWLWNLFRLPFWYVTFCKCAMCAQKECVICLLSAKFYSYVLKCLIVCFKYSIALFLSSLFISFQREKT